MGRSKDGNPEEPMIATTNIAPRAILSGYDDTDGTRNDLSAFGGPWGDWTPPN